MHDDDKQRLGSIGKKRKNGRRITVVGFQIFIKPQMIKSIVVILSPPLQMTDIRKSSCLILGSLEAEPKTVICLHVIYTCNLASAKLQGALEHKLHHNVGPEITLRQGSCHLPLTPKSVNR